MVLPFALVIAVVCYLFPFLAIYNAPASPCLQHVQSSRATASWIKRLSASRLDLLDYFDTIDVTMSSFAAAMSRNLWDPGIRSWTDRPSRLALLDVDTLALPSSPLHGVLTYDDVHNTMRRTVRRVWDPGIDPAAVLLQSLLSPSLRFLQLFDVATHRDPFLGSTAPSIAALDAFVDQVLSVDAPTIADMFHYSHPVLSRPTVPNIIFNNPVQRCRWCLL